MSLAGFKKQLNKANQFVSEKIGGIEGTKLDDEYLETEKKVDVISKLIDEVVTETQEFLQPNPAHRAKMLTMNTLNKLQGKAKNTSYPQPEGVLGDCMQKYGRDLGPDSCYGQCLLQSGESFKYLADIKYTMEDHVKDNFLQPLHSIQTHELKEINFHRKKLEGRRLDFDCKKRKQDKATATAKLPEDELKVAEEKFLESKVLAEQAMVNFLNSEVEQIQALTELVTAQVDYHRQATEIMEQLQKFLVDKKDEAASKPRPAYEPKRFSTLSNQANSRTPSQSALSTPAKNGPTMNASAPSPVLGPSCRGLYDFEAENASELPFAEGDVIRLLQQVDENWFEGELNGRRGYFPINYVEVITPLP
uniref:SH3-domain GRB2-like endophilin B1 n=1 Tax=Cryptocotyle lingua TaxID=66766 RepID=A0A7U0TJ78_9TREM|nr:SH3-domain GRB2-like endophilin B1 [Cryptocotyle lingua]